MILTTVRVSLTVARTAAERERLDAVTRFEQLVLRLLVALLANVASLEGGMNSNVERDLMNEVDTAIEESNAKR